MVRILSVLLTAAALSLPAASATAGGPGRGGGPRMFDPATVATVSGQVEDVLRYDRGRGQGIHVTLKTPEGALDVHLGPAFFLEEHSFSVAKGDSLEVTGSKVQMGGQPALIAQKVKKGDVSITLRDSNGFPVWSGRGGRRNG